MTQTSAISEHATGRERGLGHLAMLLFAALIAVSFSLGALAAPLIGPSALNAVRFVIGAAIMGGVALALLPRAALAWPAAPWRFALMGALMAAYFTTMFMALRLTSPVNAGAVFTLTPLMSAIFALALLNQRPRPVVLVSLAVAGAGAVWVIFRGDVNAILRFDVGAGEAIFFFGCAAHACYTPLVRKLRRNEPVIAFTFWTLVATAVWLAVIGVSEIAETDWMGLPQIVWISVGYLAVFTTAGTFFLLQFATVRLPSAKVMAYGYLTPCFIILIEGLAGHGWVPVPVLAGALVTVAGLAVLWLTPDS